MMESSTVLGPIGFAIGAIGFLTTTIENVYGKTQEIKEYTIRLREHRRQLANCSISISDWFERYCRSSREAESQSKLALDQAWTETDREVIEQHLEDISDSASKIEAVIGDLEHVSDPRTSERSLTEQNVNVERAWLSLTSQIRQHHRERATFTTWRNCIGQISQVDLNLALKRAAYLLYKHKDLEIRIDRLEKMIKNLEAAAAHINKNYTYESWEDPPNIEERRRLDRVNDFLQDLVLFMDQLHQRARTSPESWALELRLDPEGELRLDTKSCEFINFSIRWLEEGNNDAIERQQKMERICIVYRYRQHETIIFEELLRILHSSSSQDPARLTLQHGFELLQPKSLRHDESLRAHLASLARELTGQEIPAIEQRASLALSLIHWVILLQGCNWAANPCSCGIHRAEFEDNTIKYTLEPTGCGHHLLDPTKPSRERIEQQGRRPLLFLGIILAELALFKPISAIETNGELRFHGLSNKEVDLRHILQTVRQAVTWSYMEAVQFCFLFDESSARHNLRAENIHTFERRLLKPIRKMHQTTDRNIVRRAYRHLEV